MPLKCDSIYSEEEEVKDFKYTPNLKVLFVL